MDNKASEKDIELINQLKSLFLSEQISPAILAEATGLDITLCIAFMSHFAVNLIMHGNPRRSLSKKELI